MKSSTPRQCCELHRTDGESAQSYRTTERAIEAEIAVHVAELRRTPEQARQARWRSNRKGGVRRPSELMAVRWTRARRAGERLVRVFGSETDRGSRLRLRYGELRFSSEIARKKSRFGGSCLVERRLTGRGSRIKLADWRRKHAPSVTGRGRQCRPGPARRSGRGGRDGPRLLDAFRPEKAAEASAASERRGRRQDALARIVAPGDTFYRGHKGGYAASDIVAVADALGALSGLRFAGVTSFPTQLFNPASRKVMPTPNLTTLSKAAEALFASGRRNIEVNAPGTTSTEILPMLARAGATQIEPGHGLTGTTPLHVFEDLPEVPAVVYLSEVSHLIAGEAFCVGGGLYIDPVFPDYQIRAIVSAEPTASAQALRPAEIPSAAATDYYGMIDNSSARKAQVGDSVVFASPAGVRHPSLYCRRIGPLARRATGRGHQRRLRPHGGLAVMTAALSLRDIHKTFGGVVAIEDFNLDVGAGEIVALVGDNGAGKSTLIKIIAGVQPLTGGEMLIDGSVADLRTPAASQAQGIQVVYQDLALAERQPVYMNLFLGHELAYRWTGKLNRRRMIAETESLMADLDVRIPSARATVGELSGGQCQGIAIARATHWASKLVLMDEPTAALGVAETERVERIIQGLKARNLAILLVSHNLDQVFRLADRICVLRRGRQIGVREAKAVGRNEVVAMITGLTA